MLHRLSLGLLVNLLRCLCFLGFRWIFGRFQAVCWLVTGTYSTRRLISSSEDVTKSAHVLDIWWRCRLSPFGLPNSLVDFITVHNRFDEPSIVLHDNVTIYALSAEHALFVETDRDVDVTNSKFGSFMNISQFMYAKRVIVLPIRAVYQLADQLGDPQGRLVFLGNTTRCGSTLLCQIYEETGKCAAFSEPGVIKQLLAEHSKLGELEFNKLAVSTMRMLCKPTSSKPDCYVIKIAGPAMAQILLPLHKIYSGAKLMFMYRDGLKVAKSFSRLAQEDHLMMVLNTVMDTFPKVQNSVWQLIGYSHDYFIPVRYSLSRFFMLWAITCAKYNELRRDGIPIVAVRYEDLLENPEFATSAVLKYSGLDQDLVSKALAAFGKDSHSNTVFSQERLRRHKALEVTPDIQLELDEISIKTALPRSNESCILRGTITAAR